MEEVKRPNIEKRIKREEILLPKFMENMEEYKRALEVIAKTNCIT